MLWLTMAVVAANPGGSDGAEERPGELPDPPVDLERGGEEAGSDDGPNARTNRGRLVWTGGIARWRHPAPTTHLQLQAHIGPVFAVHVEGGVAAPTVLHGSTRVVAVLPRAAVGLVLDPVRGSGAGAVRPQVGLEATAMLLRADADAIWVAPGGGVRAAVDLGLSPALQWTVEGTLGAHAVAPTWAAALDPRLAGPTLEVGARTGWGIRW